MPTRIIFDCQIRFVQVEHVCKNGSGEYWAQYAEAPLGESYLNWGSRGPYCNRCGVLLPQQPDGMEEPGV